MALDEVEREVGQSARIVDALSRSWVRNLRTRHWQPIGVLSALLLEQTLERVLDVLQREGAHRRAAYTVDRRGERAVDQLSLHTTVRARYQFRR